MNIKEAKEQIKNAMTAYFTKDETGGYAIPVEKQRPVFLIGPPGIGKTAIMEQVASEMGVGLLSYSMTTQGNPHSDCRSLYTRITAVRNMTCRSTLCRKSSRQCMTLWKTRV